ncbi:hypothetical protein CRG98_047537 [Punica granatum]|uniref:Late embryogenesis abundant protein LEA-2 subgroup domain-containing protein n=1 Tax=Punica granatum TaxID=22663 RepID=A0A2I0HK40_PUNGR|nr:hypothetical protein CRG98_047537 [Punica granatum]
MDPHPPKYVMLPENQGSIRPPPYRRNVPRYQSKSHKSGGNCCLRCICCCYCFLVLLIFLLGTLAFYFYAVYQPQVPSYKVEEFTTAHFDMKPDFSLYTEFAVTVKADNPNSKIGFTYGKDSSVEVVYQDSTLCSGQIPAFHQGYKNVTMIKVILKGKSDFGSGLQEALMDNRKSGKIPMEVKVTVPVSVVIGEFPLRQFKVQVTCNLVVDNLTPNKKAGILSNECFPKVEF